MVFADVKPKEKKDVYKLEDSDWVLFQVLRDLTQAIHKLTERLK